MSNNQIDIEIKVDENYKVPKVVIYTEEVTEALEKMVNKLKLTNEEKIIGFKDNEAFILESSKVEIFYTENKRIFARIDNEVYQIKKRIFRLEECLENFDFVRISNSEIVNFKKVLSIDFKLTGTIMLKLKSGNNAFVSRRYVKK